MGNSSGAAGARTLRAYYSQTEEQREAGKRRRVELREKIYSLRLRGKTFTEIEGQLIREGITDVNSVQCGILLREHLKFLAAHDPEIKEARKFEADRFESLIAVLWDRAHAGDIEAINVMGTLIKSKSRLLGLEAAAKLSVKIMPVMPTAASQEELEVKQRNLFERLALAGKIPSRLSFDEWRSNPRLSGNSKLATQIAEGHLVGEHEFVSEEYAKPIGRPRREIMSDITINTSIPMVRSTEQRHREDTDDSPDSARAELSPQDSDPSSE